jgi:hypothetical protein
LSGQISPGFIVLFGWLHDTSVKIATEKSKTLIFIFLVLLCGVQLLMAKASFIIRIPFQS